MDQNYGSAATERKIYGKGIKYFSNIGVSEFLVEAEVSVGDKLLITGRLPRPIYDFWKKPVLTWNLCKQ